FHQTRPIDNQVIASRGFTVTDQRVPPFQPGQFFGTGVIALRANELGPETYQPGFSVSMGWRFENAVAVELEWLHLFSGKSNGGATFATPGFTGGPELADTFLFARVNNFSNAFAGPDDKVRIKDANGNFVN